MTNEQLAEIERRLNNATPGPWVDTDSKPEAEGVVLILAGSDPLSTDAREVCVFCDMEVCDGQDLHNSVFIAHAPTDIAALIAEVRRLRDGSAKLRESLQKLSLHADDLPVYYTHFHGRNANPKYAEQVKADVAEADALLTPQEPAS